jgi:hypothetical protein
MWIVFPVTPRSIVMEAALSDREFDDMCAANPHAEIKRTESGVVMTFPPPAVKRVRVGRFKRSVDL